MNVARKIHLPAFLLFSTLVLAAGFFIIRSSQFAAHPDLLSAAVTVDIVILVPLVYLVLARRRGWRVLSTIPILVVMLVAANLLIPQDHQKVLHTVELLLAPLELALLAFLVLKVLSIRKAYQNAGTGADDFLETLETVLAENVDSGRPGKIIATEIAMIYYGLFAWRRNPAGRPNAVTFTYHRYCGHGTVMGVFAFLVLVETGLLHWYLLPRVAPLAWVVFALSIYSLVFLFADLNAARLRPIVIDGEDLVIRVALRWRARFPIAWIERVETTTHDIDDKERLLQAYLIPNQNVILHLDRPVAAAGLYGMEKKVRRIALAVDDVPAFVEAIEASS